MASSGLSGDWANQYKEGWEQKFTPYFDELDKTQVFVLCWGPGEHAPEEFYDKRIELRDDLRKSNPNNKVITSEEIQKIDKRFAILTEIEAEELQAREADLIIALLTRQREISGVYTELLLYKNVPNFYDKTILLLPKLDRKEAKKLGFSAEVFDDFNSKNVLRYTQDQFASCETMRKFCRKRVDSNRVKKLLSRL